ncbi:hypothetical protein VCUG_02686 [Vavraia culicis subsp. floridensis]|uniref:Uncharacterized protein n=1 Tax=Vavraia culicis (isolate floridensis) TaxID=948595 RepID=L2GQ81_VAVCU|nr:uncharacterized protein VCUG_02686 [Vavraia culicis subsp. floridensis]ELA45826.1 hypothetical protein VCUG_02686 [Vavraia culicis subsp. floridensis]
MFHNLCSCVSATITYILVFDSIVNEESKDFMVLSDLENKISTSFLEQLKPRMVMHSPTQYEAPAQMVNNCGQEQNGRLCNHRSGESSNANNVGCACKTGRKSVSDYIQTTYGTTFNILRAPFKRTFLEKLSGLTRNYVPTFDHDEIMDIMMIFDYSKASDLLAYAVVVYLMNNPELVNQIQRHDSAKFNSPKLNNFMISLAASFCFSERVYEWIVYQNSAFEYNCHIRSFLSTNCCIVTNQ